jgi:LacI family transcriptional regulator
VTDVGDKPSAPRRRPARTGSARATIYEVAELAGVSPATVSRVFNGFNVSAKYANAVKKAAIELGFRPNPAARTLRTRTSEVITLVIADIENPFFTALARGVEEVARASGYSVVLCNSDEDEEREKSYLEMAASQHMAGVIITPATDHTDVSEWLAHGTPVVSVDRTLSHVNVDAVMVDNQAGARDATRRLLERGFRRIACITGPSGTETADERTSGWRNAMPDSGRAVPDGYLVRALAKDSGGREAMETLLALPEPPEAVFVGQNLMGIGVLEALASAGISPVKFGVSILGDLSFAATLIPQAVDVFSLPAREMGRTAAQLILERIGGDKRPPRTIIVRRSAPQFESD